MPVDQRNLRSLVDDEFLEKLSRIPPGMQAKAVSILHRSAIYVREAGKESTPPEYREKLNVAAKMNVENIRNWLKFNVSESGKGRSEMVAAIQAETQGFRPIKIGESQPQGTTVIMNGNGAHKPPVKERPKIWERMNRGIG